MLSAALNRLLGTAACIAATAVMAGCGPDEEPVYTSVAPGTPQASQPITTVQPTATGPAQSTGENQEGGAGDEQAAQAEFTFVVSRERILPVQISVPAYIELKLLFDSHDDKASRLKLNLSQGISSLIVPALGQKSVKYPGLKPGTYSIELEGGKGAELVVNAGAKP